MGLVRKARTKVKTRQRQKTPAACSGLRAALLSPIRHARVDKSTGSTGVGGSRIAALWDLNGRGLDLVVHLESSDAVTASVIEQIGFIRSNL